jgi:hypothetical protein
MKAKRLFFVIVVILTSHIFAQQSSRLTIAVNDLKGTGLDPSTVVIISDRLRSELVNTGAFRVIERAEMESILKEQGFQQSGACDESSCLVEVGQLLGVKRMVAGSVGMVGSFWTISLRILSVETGEILYTVDEDYEGDVKGVISEATGRAAAKLVSAGTETKRTSQSVRKGDLFIESTDAGATVEIDGKAVSGVTPITLREFPAGDYEITVRKGTASGAQKISLRPGIKLKVNIPMQQDKGSLNVSTKPSGALIFLTPTSMSVGEQLARGTPSALGKTPFQADTIEPGQYWIQFRKKGFNDNVQKITVVSNQMTTLIDTLGKVCRFLTLDYGLGSFNAGTFNWKESGKFNLEYQGLKWKTITHFGVEVTPLCFYIPEKKMHSFMIADEIGASVDQNECASSTVRRTDKLMNNTTLINTTARSFRLNRLILDVKLPIGYRFLKKPFAIVPYTGFDFRILNLVHMTGSLLDTSDIWVLPNMRFAFPVGAQFFLYLGETAFVLRFEYNSDMTFIKMIDDLDYDEQAKQNITGGFSSENVSSFVFSLGAVF